MARIADQEEAVFAQDSVDSIKTLRQNANYKQADLIKKRVKLQCGSHRGLRIQLVLFNSYSEMYQNIDHLVGAVGVKTEDGAYTRPINRLFLLETTNDNTDVITNQ